MPDTVSSILKRHSPDPADWAIMDDILLKDRGMEVKCSARVCHINLPRLKQPLYMFFFPTIELPDLYIIMSNTNHLAHPFRLCLKLRML